MRWCRSWSNPGRRVDTCALDCVPATQKKKNVPAVTCHELPDGSGRFFASAAIERHRETSKILASRGLCAGVLVAGHIGTSAGASARQLVSGNATCSSGTYTDIGPPTRRAPFPPPSTTTSTTPH